MSALPSRVVAIVCLAATVWRPPAAAADDSRWQPSVRDAITHLFAPTAPVVADDAPPPRSADPLVRQGPDPHPAPAHTGFRSLFKETGKDFLAFPRRRSTWVILGVGGAAAALAHPADDTLNAHLAGDGAGKFFALGKYLGAGYTQMGVALGLYVIGRLVYSKVADGQPVTNKWSHLGFDLLRAQMVSQVLVHSIKYTVQRDRPTGECCAFPSGHAATAFAVASVIERHLGYRLAWPTLLAATYVAASRLHDNRHYLSDVVFGASVGLATGWTIVGRHGRDSYALVPTPTKGGMLLTVVRVAAKTDSPRVGCRGCDRAHE